MTSLDYQEVEVKMSSERLAIPLEIPRSDELLSICKLFDDEREKFRCYKHYEKFCEILYQSEKSDDQDCFNEGDIVDRVVEEAIKIENYGYKIKLLKVLMVYWNKRKIFDRGNYEKIKKEILSILIRSTSESIYKMSEDFIEYECNKSYFELSFLLKQNQLKKFEFELEIFIDKCKKFYGDYWKYAMKNDARFLKEIAENRIYYKTVEFIFYKCPFVEFNSNILTEFEELKDLSFVYGDNLKEDDFEFMDKWRNIIKEFSPPEDSEEENEFREVFKKSFKDNPTTRKRVFGRITEDETSLLEEMLIYPYTDFIFKCAWEHFRLWTKPEIFSYKNPSGKTLFDHAIESGGDEQLLFLLMPKTRNTEDAFDKKKHFMVMKNNQVYTRTGECIIELLLKKLMDGEPDGSLFPHFVYLLAEIGVMKDMKSDQLIERLIYLARSDDFFEQITGLMPYDNVEMAKQLFHIEDILGNMIIYWNPKSEVYPQYKDNLEHVSSFYKLLFLIMEEKDHQFIEEFQITMTRLEESFEMRYHDPEGSESYSSNMLFILLLAAINTKQRSVIDFIFSNDTFNTIHFEFPDNIIPEEIHYYTALKFLKYKHGIGQSAIPKEWLTAEVLDEFFDSQITFNNQQLVEIDCFSLIHTENQKKKFNVQSSIDDKTIMRDDPDSLEYIINHENLKGLITHPVIEIYINLKSLKYQRIFTWNFWAFVIFFIVPFILLIRYNAKVLSGEFSYNQTSCNDSSDDPKSIILKIMSNIYIQEIFWTIAKHLHVVGIIFLLIREGFQFVMSDSKMKYFGKLSNLYEIFLFSISIALSWTTYTYTNEEDSKLLRALEVILILLTTISATSILPFAHVPNNMQILKKVALTFLRIFYTFAIILIAFSFSFCIMFQNNGRSQNCTEVNVLENSCEDKEGEKEAIDNFDDPLTALVKIITMLSGEYEIQPVSLTAIQLLFFSIFIISSFILFNLILGLSIEDVQELKKSSRAFDLMTKSERFIEVSQKVENYYMKYYQGLVEKKNLNESVFLRELSFKLIRFFLSKYVYLHNITKVLINLKTKQVFIKDAHKLQTILKRNGGLLAREENYFISKETLKDIQEIINLKNRKMFKQLKKKLEHEQQEGSKNFS